MYRKKLFHQRPKRNQKQIVLAITRKLVWALWFLCGLLIILGFFFRVPEFIYFSGFVFLVYGFIHVFRVIKRRELRRYFQIDHLQALSATHFEWYIIELFNTLGYNLEWVGGSGDQGIDGQGKNPKGQKVILQTKRYSDTNKIQPMHIREFIGTLEYHKVDIGIYVTTGFGSSGIHEYIRTHDAKKIIFIDKDELAQLINKAYQKK